MVADGASYKGTLTPPFGCSDRRRSLHPSGQLRFPLALDLLERHAVDFGPALRRTCIALEWFERRALIERAEALEAVRLDKKCHERAGERIGVRQPDLIDLIEARSNAQTQPA